MSSATRVAVTGAGGFIGRALVAKLNSAGWKVVPLQRRRHGMANEIVVGPLEDAAPIPDLEVDVFVHLAAHRGLGGKRENGQAGLLLANSEATKSSIEIAHAAGARRFVFLSSVKAVGETSPPKTIISCETEPKPTSAYGRSKLESERLVEENCRRLGMEWTIIRPPMVYGPGAGGNFKALVRLARIPLPLPFGATSNARSLVFVGNLADFIRFCALADTAADQTFLVADGEPISTKQMLAELAEAQGRTARFVAFPPVLVWRALALFGRQAIAERLFGDLAVDMSDARQAGWEPPFSRREAFEIAVGKRDASVDDPCP